MMKRLSNVGVGDYLYSYAYKYNKKKNDRKIEIHDEIKLNVERSHISDSTYKILEKLKWDCFKLLFKLLDSDQDDIINKITMDLRRIPKPIITILDPLFQEIRQCNESKNEAEFIQELNYLFEVIDLLDQLSIRI